jgi:CBS domain-containing protein
MAIAIRIDATKSSLKSLVDDYSKQGRPAVRVTCPESKCRQEYIVFHGALMDDERLRSGLIPYLTRDHPKHPVLYEIDESTPDDFKKMGAMDATPYYQPLQPSSTKVGDVMTKHPDCCMPSDTVQHVASVMRDRDVGCLPVVEGHSSRRLVGVITDRDVCCRATAGGYDPQRTTIEPYISRNLITCFADDELEHCFELLHQHGLHRVLVVDDEGSCVGIVAPSDAPDRPEVVFRREFERAIRSKLEKHGLA